ncbi:MAG: tyrosine-type recombinase/integrase [Candidatus Marinimicrobia bacterium]|nr:tyrosine-type recombinase/integrase [Candidatus Neomarinimicrobiota bacterium]
MKDLKLEAIQKHYLDLFEKTDSSNQVKELHKIINPCLRYAFNKGDILRDFSRMLQIPRDSPEKIQARIGQNSVKPLTREEHMLFIKGIHGHELEALFRTAIDTGARQGELFALTWHDIDFEKKIIVINKSYSYSKGATDTFIGQTGPTKCNEIRRNKLAHVLIEILQQHKVN